MSLTAQSGWNNGSIPIAYTPPDRHSYLIPGTLLRLASSKRKGYNSRPYVFLYRGSIAREVDKFA